MQGVRSWTEFVVLLGMLAAAALAASRVIAQEAARSDGTFASAGRVDDARMLRGASEPENWLVNGGTFNGEHYSALDQVNVSTVADLKPAWSFDFDTSRGQESEPLVVDGVMYVTTAWSKVYALDAATGAELWTYDPRVPGESGAMACCDVVNRGAAVYHGKVFIGTIDGRLIALDAKNGAVVWSARTIEPGGRATITGAPRVIKNKVIIGNGGADMGARGYVSAYDTETGKPVWRFYLVPGDPAKPDKAASDDTMAKLVRPTWSGDYARYGGGGTAWNAIVYDAELDQLYIGTGNGAPWNPQYRTNRRGDNLFLCSIVALNPDTGKYIWHYQENPQEAWDYNSVMPMILTTLHIDGRARKVLLQAPKNGLFYVIDRTSGKVISAHPIVPVTWTTGVDLATGRPAEVPGSRYEAKPFMIRPGPAGAHNWQPMAFSPQTGLVYLGASENGMEIRSDTNFKPKPYLFNDGVLVDGKVLPPKDYLLAWNPVTQREAWRVPQRGGGVLATAGGLVFQGRGTGTGELAAMRASDGKQLWSFHMPNGVEAGAISYAVRGAQYIAVATGARLDLAAGALSAFAPQPGRLVAFRLNGTAKLPADPAPAPPPNPPSEAFTPAAVEHGRVLYRDTCTRCHGFDASSGNIVPDLRRSAVLTDKTAWAAIVHDGALTEAGMIGWSRWLSRADVEDVRAFVAHQAIALQDELAGRKPAHLVGGAAQQ